MGSKTWIAGVAAVAAATALFAAPAQARTSISLNIGVPGVVYSEPAYVYSQPSYVYSEPAYVYSQPSYVYRQPSYVYARPYRHHHRPYGWRDSDHDGVPNRFDRRPHNPYRY